ncbi:MAG: ABC transporter permease [Actinobacteria bacterium RBG_16_67_10]|nr:MAG: ABC transporter permease [Actinobacteria bacterium RBG_16_67_10]
MTAVSQTPRTRTASLEVVPLRKTGRYIGAAVVAVLAILLAQTLVTNERFRWDEVGHYLFASRILEGLGRTLLLTFGAMSIAVLLGTLIAVMRLTRNPLLTGAAWSYVWLFRGTPVLVQLIFWYNLSALFPSIDIGIPFFGPTFFSFSANEVISVYVAALLGLGLCEAAYMSEIVRAGISSIDRGQTDAAQALGMTSLMTFRKVVMPQAMRVIVPPTANEVIGMLKTTALVSVIALPDLLYSAQLIYNREFNTIPLLIVACFWYLVLASILSFFQSILERRFGRGHTARNTREPIFGFLRRSGRPSPGAVKAGGASK